MGIFNRLKKETKQDSDISFVAKTARDFENERIKESFKKLYGKIEELRTAIYVKDVLHLEPKYSMDEYKAYAMLKSAIGDVFFLPYLLEKREYGLLSNDEALELETIEKRFDGVDLNRQYYSCLGFMQGMGMIDILNEAYFKRSLPKHTTMKSEKNNELFDFNRKDIKTLGDYLKVNFIDNLVADYDKQNAQKEENESMGKKR